MSKKSYVYELRLKDMYLNETCFIKGKISVDKMKKLIFYIQCKYYDILPQSILTASDLQEILLKCYGMERVSRVEADEIIDLNWSFKQCFNKEKRDNMMNCYKIYEAVGLVKNLRRIVDLTIGQWR